LNGLLALWRLARLLVHFLHGLWVVQRRFGRCAPAERHALISWWSRKMLRLLGIEVQVPAGADARPTASTLLVANHVSWLDIAAIHALLPQARFVSKADIRHWPVVGALVEGAGTLFIERSSKRDAMRVVHETAAALKSGDCVAVFPEGTTGPGPEMLPFHANLLQAAIAVEASVLPVVLRWHEPGQRFSVAAQFIGDTTLVQSLWRVASARGLGVELQVLDAVPTAGQDRRVLAQRLRSAMAVRLG
jgi:1-acyl-sn-glycerol-3-phosphate acyltransferase